MRCMFASDNTSGIHPRILEAMASANEGAALPYGDDPWTAEAEACFRSLFGDDIEVFLVPLGTGANTLSFNSMVRSWNAVICSDMAHTLTTESGAIEAIVGCKMLPVPSVHGKIDPAAVESCLDVLGDPHHNQPRLVALTQATEVGTLYTPDEIRALCDTAHRNGLLVHVDGARIANAVAAQGGDVRALTRDLGVDVMSFGGTKNGMMMGEAVLFFNRNLADGFGTLRKQCLQLHSKMRFLAAQYVAYFRDGLWLENARHANAMARLMAELVADMPYVSLAHPVETNGVFANMRPEDISRLQEQYAFYEVDPVAHTVRWMFSFNTQKEDVYALAEALGRLA